MDGFLNKRFMGKEAMLNPSLRWFQNNVRCGCLDEFLRCFSTKVGSDMIVNHDLLRHLSCTMFLTLRKDRISMMSSSGRNKVGYGAIDLPDRHRRFLVGGISIIV